MEEHKRTGWDDIDAALEALYPNQKPLHYGTLIRYSLGGNDPLDGISIYDAGNYYHFVTYGFSEIYERENDSDISGFGFELTYKLKKNTNIDENELKNFAGVLQTLARYIFNSKTVFKPHEYIATGQQEGMDSKKQSKIVGFVTIEDPQLKTINTVNGKLQFVELIGATYNELNKIMSKEKTSTEMIDEIIARFTDVTDYSRESLY